MSTLVVVLPPLRHRRVESLGLHDHHRPTLQDESKLQADDRWECSSALQNSDGHGLLWDSSKDLSSDILKDQPNVLPGFDVFLSGNRVKIAERIFDESRRAGKELKARDYDSLITAFIEAKNHTKARMVFRMMLSDEVLPSFRSYILLILSHTQVMLKSSNSKTTERCKKRIIAILRKMRRDGYDPSRMCQQVSLSQDHAFEVRAGIRSVWPDFRPAAQRHTAAPHVARSLDEQKLLDMKQTADEKASEAAYATMTEKLNPAAAAALEQWRRECSVVVNLPMLPTVSSPTPPVQSVVETLNDSADTAHFSVFRPYLTARLAELRAQHEPKGKPPRVATKKPELAVTSFVFVPTLTDEDLAEATLSVLEKELVGHDKGSPTVQVTHDVGKAVFMRHFVRQQAAWGPEEFISGG